VGREGKHRDTRQDEKTTESALGGDWFQRARERILILVLSPGMLIKPRCRSQRLVRALEFSGDNSLDYLATWASVCQVYPNRNDTVFPTKVCANVCAKQDGRHQVARN
jgi:uridine kinase